MQRQNNKYKKKTTNKCYLIIKVAGAENPMTFRQVSKQTALSGRKRKLFDKRYSECLGLPTDGPIFFIYKSTLKKLILKHYIETINIYIL